MALAAPEPTSTPAETGRETGRETRRETGRRPPRVLNVVWDVDFAEQVDWSSWYLTDEEDMGQHPRQSEAIFALRDVVTTRMQELGRHEAFIGADAFFAWVEEEPLVRVSPDVYVLSRRPDPIPASFQLWREGLDPPILAAEIVSEDWKKDYEAAPQKYAQLGAGELLVFDPDAVDRDDGGGTRVPIQVFRRTPDGIFTRAYAGPGPALLRSLEAYAVVRSTEVAPVVRLAYDAAGERLVPTLAERATLERDEAARERDEAARERDAERQRRLELEARLAALEAATQARDGEGPARP